jgi:hypothetical protein
MLFNMCASTESQDSDNFCSNCLVMEENLNESVEAASVPNGYAASCGSAFTLW